VHHAIDDPRIGWSRAKFTLFPLILPAHSSDPLHSLTNSIQGITWRLGFGIQDTANPEGELLALSVTYHLSKLARILEWQSHPADVNLPLTLQT
jgi:hypothetical protein